MILATSWVPGSVVGSGPILEGGIMKMLLADNIMSSKVVIRTDSCTGGLSKPFQNVGCSE